MQRKHCKQLRLQADRNKGGSINGSLSPPQLKKNDDQVKITNWLFLAPHNLNHYQKYKSLFQLVHREIHDSNIYGSGQSKSLLLNPMCFPLPHAVLSLEAQATFVLPRSGAPEIQESLVPMLTLSLPHLNAQWVFNFVLDTQLFSSVLF